MPRLYLKLLGMFEASLDGSPVRGFESDKVRALLTYLAVESDRSHRREILAGLLWPDMAERDARTNLRQALANLRKTLGDQTASPPFLLINRQTIQFNDASDYLLDVRDFTNFMATRCTHVHTSLLDCDVCAARLRDVVRVYRGEFLEGFSLSSNLYEEWMVVQREKLHIQALDVLDHLAAYHEKRGEYSATQRYAQRQVELEPWRECAHRQLMRVFALSGRRGMALAQYDTCKRVLERELGVEPEVETTALYEQIRRGELHPESAISTEPVTKPPVPFDMPAPVIPAEGHITDGTPQTVGPQTPTQLVGERRVVTALGASVKESVTQSGNMDIETWAEMMHDVIPVLEREVKRYGGAVNQVREDGLLVLYGLTVTHEDDPERAVLTALAMQEAFERCSADLPAAVNLYIGISTGEVITTSIGDQRSSSRALGRVTAIAERMGEAAEPGTVLVTEATYRLSEPLFEWQMRGRFQVQGVRRPVAVYRPLAHKELITKGRGIEGLESSLVGRDEEFQALQEAVGRLRSGIGRIVTIVGEAGIGKSRLVTELKSDALENSGEVSVNWLEGRCLSYANYVAYQVWINMLRTWLGTAEDTPPENVNETLKTRVRDACLEIYSEVYPFLARLLSLPLDEDAAARVQDIDAGGLQVLTFQAVETLIERASQQIPLVLVCEDLHWADPTSLALLERLLSLTDRIPLLLICVMRPVTTHDCWHIRELAARDYRHRHTDLRLDPLSPAESGTLIGNLLHIEDLPTILRNRILERAEGNPFFLEEILRSMIEDEVLTYDKITDPSTGRQTNRWVAAREIDTLNIPDTLHGVLIARIDRLDPQVKRVLQLASVIGRTFSYGVLAAITENVDSKDVNFHLVMLQRAQLIRERVRLPEREYIFKHVMIQEAAYNGLLKRERRAIHRQVAEVLERLYPNQTEVHLGLLAHHCEQAGDQERAVYYLRRAGKHAAAQYANAEAVDYLSRALELVPDTDVVMRYNLLLSREKVYDLQGKRELQAHDLMKVELLAAILDAEYRQAGKSYRAETGLRKIRLAMRWGNKYTEAEEQARKTLRQAQESQDTFAEAAAYREWGRALFYCGYFDDSLLKIERALAIARKAGLKEVEEDSLNTLGFYYVDSGDYLKAQTTFEQQLMVCHEIGSRSREGIALRRLSRVFLDQRDYNKAMEYAEESLRVCRETGNRRDEGWAFFRIGQIYCYQDRRNYTEIEDCALQALKIFRETGEMGGIGFTYSLLMLVAQSQDDDTRELKFSKEALNTFRQLGNRKIETLALRNIGWSLFRQGRYGESQSYFEQAYRIGRELKLSGLQFDSLSNLGRLFFTIGNYCGAKTFAEESLAIAREKTLYYLECGCLVILGLTAHAAGDDEAAQRYGQQVLTLAQENKNMYWQGPANLILGNAITGLGEWDAAIAVYNQSLDITEQEFFKYKLVEAKADLSRSTTIDTGMFIAFAMGFISVEAKAGLSRLKLMCGDYSSALALVEDILLYLQEKPQLRDTFEPFRIYLTCYQVLEANGDARAQKILKQAYNLIQERAATIEDEALHRSYLENVPENREIVRLWEEKRKDVMT